jgi:hypothetical protein
MTFASRRNRVAVIWTNGTNETGRPRKRRRA